MLKLNKWMGLFVCAWFFLPSLAVAMEDHEGEFYHIEGSLQQIRETLETLENTSVGELSLFCNEENHPSNRVDIISRIISSVNGFGHLICLFFYEMPLQATHLDALNQDEGLISLHIENLGEVNESTVYKESLCNLYERSVQTLFELSIKQGNVFPEENCVFSNNEILSTIVDYFYEYEYLNNIQNLFIQRTKKIDPVDNEEDLMGQLITQMNAMKNLAFVHLSGLPLQANDINSLILPESIQYFHLTHVCPQGEDPGNAYFDACSVLFRTYLSSASQVVIKCAPEFVSEISEENILGIELALEALTEEEIRHILTKTQ